MPAPAAILFDLDGTLIDSAPDISTALNVVLSRDNLSSLPLDTVRQMIGQGIRTLVERAYAHSNMPLDTAALDIREAVMLQQYGDNLTDQTVLYANVLTTLDICRSSGARLGIVTNKPRGPTARIVDHFFRTAKFDIIVAGDDAGARKPDPAPIMFALAHLSLAPDNAMMVGDSDADVTAARRAGVYSVLIAGGYGNDKVTTLADCILSQFSDLPGIFATWR